jgi:hypothetical protein
MRSEAVYRANGIIRERYRLCKALAMATRKLHVPSRRIEDTINAALAGVGQGNMAEVLSILLLTMNARHRPRALSEPS